MKIEYSKQAIKFLEKQDIPTRKRLKTEIENLPYGDVKKMQGTSGYRLRVGDFRILFDREGYVFAITRIDNRGQIYK